MTPVVVIIPAPKLRDDPLVLMPPVEFRLRIPPDVMVGALMTPVVVRLLDPNDTGELILRILPVKVSGPVEIKLLVLF